MFRNDPVFGFVAFAFAVLINRLLAEKALRRLTPEEKVRVIDSFAAHRTYNLLVLMALMIGFIVAMQVIPAQTFALSVVFFAAVTIAQVLSTVLSYSKFKKLQAPKPYLNNFLIRCVVYYCGLAVLMLSLTFRYLK